MLVNATNVKSQKNVFVIHTEIKFDKLAKINSVIKLKLKRSTMKMIKLIRKYYYREKNVINFEK